LSRPYHCIKLKTGETLFAEVINVDDRILTILHPMLVTTEVDGTTESMSMIPWIPYIESAKIDVPLNHIYFSDSLNKQFFEYYGRVVIQSEINKIKLRVAEKMENRFDILTIADGLAEMKKLSDELTKKFGVPGPDFSEFEEVLERHKSEIVLH